MAMQQQNIAGGSPTHFGAANIRWYYPYFTPDQVRELSEKQRGKLSVTQEEKARHQACGFIEAVGAKIGFPRKTIATAQNLYHRFHLFFPRKDFSYYDVTMAALYVSTKLHDTLKKPREILMVAYGVRNPELVAKSKVAGELDVDPNKVEQDRQRLLGVERLILETICFNFKGRMPFPYVIKFGHSLQATKRLTKMAWRLASDSFWTVINLEYPPHVVALACIYLAALLSTLDQTADSPNFETNQRIAMTLGNHGAWEHQFKANVSDLEEIAHAIIDLLIQAAQNPLSNTSPSTPSSPHPSRTQHSLHQQAPLPQAPYTSDQLIKLKIAMRETEHTQGPRSTGGVDFQKETNPAMLGRNEGTVRFAFEPSWYDKLKTDGWENQ
ncbi:cyclin-like protein [Abortiporus biennis]|nr:cyclin-like protein [Abortiporus biennis]